MSDAAAAAATTVTGTQEGEPTAAPEPVRGYLSDMAIGKTVTLPSLDAPPPKAANTQAREPAQQPPTPEVAEGEVMPDPLEAQPDAAPEQPAEGPTPEELAAEWQRHKDSPDLDLEAFGDKVIWTKDREGNPVPMRVADVERHTMLYADYQFKTRELSARNRELDGKEAGMQAFARDLTSGDPQLAMKAMRWMGAEKSMHAMVVAYVQRMAQLEGMDPGLREQFLAGERARDEAEILKRQLQARQQQEQQLREQEAQQQGLQAPDIQHVMTHISSRLPALCKAAGVVESPAFDRELGEILVRATEGERGPDGRWLVAPVIQRGRTPTDDVLRDLVGQANERVQALIAAAAGRMPPKPKLPPSPAATSVTGSAAKPGTRGHIGEPQRMRWSDMGKPRR